MELSQIGIISRIHRYTNKMLTVSNSRNGYNCTDKNYIMTTGNDYIMFLFCNDFYAYITLMFNTNSPAHTSAIWVVCPRQWVGS